MNRLMEPEQNIVNRNRPSEGQIKGRCYFDHDVSSETYDEDG